MTYGNIGACKPILFNTEMVRAILEGRKTQTRRINKGGSAIVKPNMDLFDPVARTYGLETYQDGQYQERVCLVEAPVPICPGDVLWVRETWCNLPVSAGGHTRLSGRYYYKADNQDIRPDGWRGNWKPSIHMPKEAARIFLRVTSVRCERLSDMTEEDAIAEGFPDSPAGTDSPLERFSALWDKTIKRELLRDFGWHADPYVWVIKFERIKEE